MKKLLLFLLLLPLFAHAQDPKPPTPIILGSQFYKSITGSDTSYYVFDTKTSLWRRLVTYRESILPFTNNFKLLGDTVDLADTIHALHSFINVDTLHPVAKFLGYNRSTNPSSIVEFWQDGVLKAFEGEAGGHYGSGIAYISGQDYSLVSTELTGTTISRNRADTNTVFKLKNYALSGHADFLNVQNGLVKIDYLGVPTFHGIKDTTGIDTVVTIKNGKFYKGIGGGGGTNIYNSDGALTGDRIVDVGPNNLRFSTNSLSGSGSSIYIDSTGVQLNTVGTGTDHSAIGVSNSGPNSNVYMQRNYFGTNASISLPGLAGVGTGVHDGLGYGLLYDASSDYAAGLADPSINPLLILPKEANDLLYAPIGGGSGTVTSVAATGANGIGVSGSPITTSGTLALSLGNITPTSISTIVKPATTFQTGAGTAYTDSLVVKTSGGLTAISPNSYLHSPTIAGHGLVNGFNTTLAQLAYGYGVVLQSGTSVYDGSGGSTFRVDTGTTIQTVANFFPKGDTRYAKTGSTGTVTSVATSSATGILGGTITSTGTISADTTVLRTVANSRSLAQTQTALNLKANIASPTFTGTVTIPNGGVFGTPTSLTLTNATGLPNAGLTNSSITVNGTSIALGASGTATAAAGTLTGTTLNSTVVTSSLTSAALANLTATDATLTFSGSYNGNTARTVGLNLANANTWTALPTVNIAGIAATSTDGLVLTNTTASTSGVAVQTSPRLHFTSHVWNTTATAADNVSEWINEIRPTSGGTPTSKMYWAKRQSVSGTGSFSDIMVLSDDGRLTIGGAAAQVNAADAIITTVYASGANGAGGAMINGGSNFGQMQNGSGDVWQLGYGPSKVALGTAVIKWNTTNATIAKGALIHTETTAAINSSATATAAQMGGGYITSSSAAPTTITTTTATLLATQVGGVRGSWFEFTIDNTLGASTVTLALDASITQLTVGPSSLTVPSGVTGVGTWRVTFVSTTAATISRIQ